MRPVSSYQLAWWLRHHGIESQVIEFCQLLPTDVLIRLIEKSLDETTHSICISTVFWPTNPYKTPQNISSAVKFIKEKYPFIKIIGGGQNINRYENLFDIKMAGEGEDQLLKYCLEKVNKTTTSHFNIVDCQHLYSEKDFILEHESVPIELGRGCIFKCKFCSAPNLGKLKKTYQRKYDYVFDDIKNAHEKFGTTNFMFLDDTINEDNEKMEFLATIPKRLGVDITWGGYIRVDLIWSQKNHNLLFDSGLRNAYFGLETFHPEASQIIGKGWNGKHGKEWIPILYNDLWNKQVKFEASFIVGLPKEKEDSLYETAKWVNELQAGNIFFYALDLKHDTTGSELESVFTREYPKYNYTIDPVTNQWINEENGFTRKKAETVSAELNKLVYKKAGVGGWTSFHLYNAGMEIEDIRNVPLTQVGPILDSALVSFVKRYVSKFESYYS